MDFGGLLSRAARMTWQHKVLWVLGFLTALGAGSTSNFNFSSTSRFTMPAADGEMPRWMSDLASGDPSVLLGGLMAGLAVFGCVLALLSIILLVIGLIARGGLIAAVRDIETEGGTTFGRAWSAGASRFWRMLGLNILLILPVIVLGVIMLVAFGGTILAIIGAAAAGGRSSGGDEAAAAALAGVTGVLCVGGVLTCVAIIYGLISMALQTFGERAIVLDGLGVMDSLRKAWEVFRANLGNIIVIALIMAVISFVVGLIVGAISAAVFIPTVLMAMGQAETGVQASTVIVGLLSFVIVVVLAAVVSALFVSFNSAAWTLAYRQFTGQAPAPIPAPDVPAPLPTN
jgi:hypothetical protein